MTRDHLIRQLDFCLGVSAGSPPSAGQAVRLEPCNGNNNRQVPHYGRADYDQLFLTRYFPYGFLEL